MILCTEYLSQYPKKDNQQGNINDERSDKNNGGL